MNDPQLAVRNYLTTVAPVTALTGSRIYASRNVPPPGYQPSQGSAITFQVRGGFTDYAGSHLSPSLQFKCYGINEVAANALYGVLYDAFRGHAGDTIKSVQVEVLGQTLEEPQTGWIFVLSFFRFWMRA